MSIDIKQQLIARVHKSVNFAIQLDETTDISSNAQLMVYVRPVPLIRDCLSRYVTVSGQNMFTSYTARTKVFVHYKISMY